MNILVVTGGKINFDFALDFLGKNKFEQVIAVDGGLEAVQRMEEALGAEKFKLAHIVGDFDTVNHHVLDVYKERKDIQIHAFRPEKDYTDTDIALKLAMSLVENDADARIVMLGATGTRLDHVLANIQMLKMPMEAGIECQIIDDHNRIRMIEGEYTLTNAVGKYVSLVPVSQTLEGVSLHGFKYPLDDRNVYLGESLCISNEVTKLPAHISIRKGMALLIESWD